MKYFLIGFGGFLSAIAFLFLMVLIGGALTSPSHRIERSVEIGATPEVIYATITDFAATPSWRSDILKVEMLSKPGERPKWREYDKDEMNWAFEAEKMDPPNSLVIRIAEPNPSVEGSWTISITPAGSGSRVTLVEEGIVHNLVFRFLGKLFFDQSATIDAYLEALRKKYK